MGDSVRFGETKGDDDLCLLNKSSNGRKFWVIDIQYLFPYQIPEDVLYEELNIYSPIYSELEERGETAPPTDS